MTKNHQYRHSERSEESPPFTFSLSHISLFKRGDPSAYSLRMTRKGKLIRILEHPIVRFDFGMIFVVEL